MSRNLRDHGLPPGGVPAGKPTWVVPSKKYECPNCGGEMVHVRLPMKAVPRLRGGKGTGLYMGCPCCPFASPMVVTATSPVEAS